MLIKSRKNEKEKTYLRPTWRNVYHDLSSLFLWRGRFPECPGVPVRAHHNRRGWIVALVMFLFGTSWHSYRMKKKKKTKNFGHFVSVAIWRVERKEINTGAPTRQRTREKNRVQGWAGPRKPTSGLPGYGTANERRVRPKFLTLLDGLVIH